MKLSYSEDNEDPDHPGSKVSQIREFGSAVDSRNCNAERQSRALHTRHGRTTYVKAIISNPKLSSTQILAQKLANEALKSQAMQDTFRRLTEIKVSNKDTSNHIKRINGVNAESIVHPLKLEKNVSKRRKGVKNGKHKRHRERGRRHKLRGGRRSKRSLPKKESSEAEWAKAPMCKLAEVRNSRDSTKQSRKKLTMTDSNRIQSQDPMKLMKKSTSSKSEALKKLSMEASRLSRQNDDDNSMQVLPNFDLPSMNATMLKLVDDNENERQLFERESMVAHLMKTTTKDPSKNSSGDQGVEYSEYYSDSDNNSPPENKAQSKLNEATKNVRVRSIRETMNLPFYYDPRFGPQNNFFPQPIPYSSSSLQGGSGCARRECQRSVDNTVKSAAYRNYDPNAQSDETGYMVNYNTPGVANGNLGAMYPYANNPSLENSMIVPTQFPSVLTEQNSYIANQVPVGQVNNFLQMSLPNGKSPLPGTGEYNPSPNNEGQQPGMVQMIPVESFTPQQVYPPSGMPQQYVSAVMSQLSVSSDKPQSSSHYEDSTISSTTVKINASSVEQPVVISAENKERLNLNPAETIDQSASVPGTMSADNRTLSSLTSDPNLSPNNNSRTPLVENVGTSSSSSGTSSSASTGSTLPPIPPQSIGSGNTVPSAVSGSKSLPQVVREIERRVNLNAPVPESIDKKPSDNWSNFRGTNRMEALAPQAYLQMESPPSLEEHRPVVQLTLPGESNGTSSTTKLSEITSAKVVGDATALPPDTEEARIKEEKKAKGAKVIAYDLLPMTTQSSIQGVTASVSAVPVNITAMVNETKAVASEILYKIIDELEELKLDHPKNEQKEGLPCRLTGSWVTIRAGVRIDMKVTNHSIAVNLDKLTPPPAHEGLLNITWNVTGHAPFKRGGPFTLVAMDNHTKTLAVFVGACKVCQGIDTIEGLWTVSREPRDCRDFQMSTSIFNEIFRRTRLISEINEAHRKHDSALSSTFATPHQASNVANNNNNASDSNSNNNSSSSNKSNNNNSNSNNNVLPKATNVKQYSSPHQKNDGF